MKNIYIISILLMVQSLLCVSCSNNNNNIKSLEESSPSMTRIPPRNEKGNGVYHWKTLFNLSDYERSFLKEHDIKYLYVRMFDVDYGEDFDGTTHSVPIATTRFLSQIPSGIEVIPVVYITQSAIKKDSLWYYPVDGDANSIRLEQIIETSISYQGKRLRDRYTLQAIRALFTLQQYGECINLWLERQGEFSKSKCSFNYKIFKDHFLFSCYKYSLCLRILYSYIETIESTKEFHKY